MYNLHKHTEETTKLVKNEEWNPHIYLHTDKTVPSAPQWQIVCRLGSRPRWSDCLQGNETFWCAAPPSGHHGNWQGHLKKEKKKEEKQEGKKNGGEGRHKEER